VLANRTRALTLAITLGFAGGSCAVAHAPSRNGDSSNLWEKMDDSGKFGYILGFSNASENYQMVLRAEREGCNEETKAHMTAFLEDNPISHTTLARMKSLVDEVYEDPRNRGINLVFAMQIAGLRVAGRPQSEIERQLQQMRQLTTKP